MSVLVSFALFYMVTDLLWDLPGNVLAAPASALCGWERCNTLSPTEHIKHENPLSKFECDARTSQHGVERREPAEEGCFQCCDPVPFLRANWLLGDVPGLAARAGCSLGFIGPKARIL